MTGQRCIVYSRVSTDAQEREGTSLDSQEEQSVACARERGWLVVACVRDAASGFSLERPGLERVRSAVRDGQVDVVLAYALDRLSRKPTHIAILAEECADAGVRLEFVTESFEESATGQFLRSAKAFAAELEREKIAERTMRGKAQRARAGKLPQATGRSIYGYDDDSARGTRRINSEQAAVVRRIFAGFCAGGSCHGIAVELRAEGVPTLSGSVWHPLTVRRVLENETYTGRTVYRRTRVTQVRDPRTGKKRRRVELREASDWIEVPEATPAIVEPSLFARAQELLRDPLRRLWGVPTQRYPLRGHVRCLACATPMVGQALMQGQYRYYRCRRSFAGHLEGVCGSRYVRADLLEATVRRELARVIAEPARLLDEARRLNGVSVEQRRLAALGARLGRSRRSSDGWCGCTRVARCRRTCSRRRARG